MSAFFLNTSQIHASSNKPQVNERLIVTSVLKELKPITLANQDLLGRRIQLWKYRNGFIGAILNPDGSIHVVSPQKIHSSLQPSEPSSSFLTRITNLPPRKWGLVATANLHIIVWPHLVAAGRPGPDWKAPQFPVLPSERGHTFLKKQGHLEHDTPDNQRILEYVTSRPEHWVATDRHGADVYFAMLPDGRQGWARAKVRESTGRPQIIHCGVNEKGEFARFSDKLGIIETCFQGKVAYRVHQYASKFFFGEGDGPKPGGKKGPPPTLPIKSHVALSQFKQLLQQTGLVASYNSSHPHNRMPEKGEFAGKIGGVACSTTYIKGLFEGPEGLFEDDYFFALPAMADGAMPFTNQQLKQILRELAVGIYVHSTVPFFSLHFRHEGSDLFPVIHPAYEKTLVGRVISMLDYWMKAYLNGAIYKEDFIDNWHLKRDWKKYEASALSKVIEFDAYCKEHMSGSDKEYMSLASLQNILIDDPSLPEVLRSFKGFKNSFRIIAKENSLQKEGNLFVLDGDFDVFYEIQPSPEYELALNEYIRKNGHPPESYVKMKQTYALMAQRIHDHMVKMPLCKEYFSLLSVINFFSGYFSTLKKHRKIPSLTRMAAAATQGCPSVFPHLPVVVVQPHDIKFNMHKGIKEALAHHKTVVQDYFKGFFLHLLDGKTNSYKPEEKASLIQLFKEEFTAQILSKLTPPMRRYFQANLNHVPEKLAIDMINGIEQALKNLMLKDVPGLFKKQKKAGEERKIGEWKANAYAIVPNFLQKIIDVFKDKDEAIVKFAAPVAYLPHEVSDSTREKIHRVVGGCGLRLQQQDITPSTLGASLRANNMHLLLNAPSETLTPFPRNGGKPYVFFRLFNEDVPPALVDDYDWMEDSLLIPPGETFDRLEVRLDIQEAITENDKEKFLALLESTPRLTELKDKYARNLLHHAATHPHPFFVEKLLAKGFLISEQDVHGFIPLHYAAMGGKSSVCGLLSSKDTINHVAKNGATPLSVAIQNGKEDVVRLLLSQGALFTLLAGGYSTLHCALHEGKEEIIFMILASPLVTPFINICCTEGGTPLMLATDLGNKKIIDILMSLGADPNIARADGLTAIEIAAVKEHMPVLESLLAKAEPSELALEVMAKKASVTVAQKILKQLYDYKNKSQDNALHVALRYGNIALAIYLIENCTQIQFLKAENIEKETATHMAIALKLWVVIEALHKKGVVTAPKLLLAMGYHPILKERFEEAGLSQTELQACALIAAQTGNFEALTYIFEPLGVDLLAIKGPKGWGILHYLAKCDGLFLFRKYLSRVADIRQRLVEDGHKTLAAIAVEFSSKRVLSALLTVMKVRGLSLDKEVGDKHLFYVALENHCDEMFFDIFDPVALACSYLDSKKTLPAHVAAQIGSERALVRLSLHGADLVALDKAGKAPIDYAVRVDSFKSVAFLLSKGALVTSYSLYLAASRDNQQLLQLLVTHNKKAEILDESLMQSIRKYDFTAFNRLLSCNASLKAISSDGWTPTLLASQSGQEKILRRILQIEPKDERAVNGKRPLHFAASNKHRSCVALLLHAGHKDQASATGVTARQMGGIEMQSIFQGIEDSFGDAFLKAIKSDDVVQMRKILTDCPMNQLVTVDLGIQQIRGTLVQLLIRLTQDQDVHQLYPEWLIHPGLSPNVPDEQGNTLAHILLNKQVSPLGIRGIDLSKTNHEGVTPLHVAAQHADKALFSSIIMYLRVNDLLNLLEATDCMGNTPIFYAIKGGKEDNVKQLLESGVNIAHLNHQLLSPLATACIEQSLGIIKCLLSAGANPNQRLTTDRITVLHIALSQKNFLVSCYLLAHGSSPNIANIDGMYPLHLAVEAGFDSVVTLMSKLGISVNTPDKFGLEPKYRAAMNGNTSMLAMILSHQERTIDDPVSFSSKQDEIKQIKGRTLLHLACLSSHPSTVSWLLEKGANPEVKAGDSCTALSFAAASDGSSAILPLFNSYRLVSDPRYLYEAIVGALQTDNLDAVINLYGRGISLHDELMNGYTGLHIAAQAGAMQSTAWFLLQDVDITAESKTKETAIELAAANCSPEQFKLMIQDPRIPVNQVNLRGESLGHIAAKAGKISHMMVLIKHGLSLDITDNQGRTPLHFAAKAGHSNFIRLLLACGANPNVRDGLGALAIELISESDSASREVMEQFRALRTSALKGQTALHLAVRSQSQLAVQVLSQVFDVDALNAKDVQGYSAFYLSVKAGQKESACMLIQAGAEVSTRNQEGYSPLWFVSVAQPSLDMVKLLVGAGVSIEDKRAVIAALRSKDTPHKAEILTILESS